MSKSENELIFASARPIRDMLPLLSDFPDNFLIGGNGSIVRNKGKIEVVQTIDFDDFEQIKELIKQHDLDYLVDSDWNYSLRNRNDKKANINEKVDAGRLAKNVLLIELSEIIKCNLLNVEPSKILTELSKLNVEIVQHENTASLDITAKNINKYRTFRDYFPEEAYIAFGNDTNDVELLKHAALSVAVGKNRTLEFADIHVNKNKILDVLKEKKWQN
ncbi:HAD hydrolase family protein [Lactococcus nasutitermitis]|uniref:HAD hydrolase family protein n=1 Tax=Lactococcus nasutitermitis TaxID=1652957 RepID=UPI0024551A5F|nr:HAD hydrolase family protein [Lactococcus nasutitermitis]